MEINNLVLEKLLTIDNTGMPVAPTIRQLQDRDVLQLYTRDKTHNKSKYIKEVGYIYYMADPKSPAKQQGLSDNEAHKLAIENYDLPANYTPDDLINRLIKKYYFSCITEAGVALETLQKSIHLVSIAANKINEHLNNKLSSVMQDEDITNILALIDSVSKRIIDIPNLLKSLSTAYDNLKNEEETQLARGGKNILSSMDADDTL